MSNRAIDFPSHPLVPRQTTDLIDAGAVVGKWLTSSQRQRQRERARRLFGNVQGGD